MTSASSNTVKRSSTAALAEQAAADPATQVAAPATPAAPALAEVKVFKPNPPLADRLHLAESARTNHVLNCEEKTLPVHLLDPAYWTHLARKLRPYDRLEVRANDGTWLAEFVVLSCGQSYARVKELSHWDLTSGASPDVEESADEPFYVKYLGPQDAWGVVRRSDQAKMLDGIDTKENAVTHARQMIRAATK